MEDAQGIIYYEINGKKFCWEVSAHPDLDTTDKLKEHFIKYSKRSSKNPKFIGAEFLQRDRK